MLTWNHEVSKKFKGPGKQRKVCVPRGFGKLDARSPWQRSAVFPGGVVLQMFSAGGVCVSVRLCRSRTWCFWGGGGRKHSDVCLRWLLTRADCHHCSYWWNVTLVCVWVCLCVVCVCVCVCVWYEINHGCVGYCFSYGWTTTTYLSH